MNRIQILREILFDVKMTMLNIFHILNVLSTLDSHYERSHIVYNYF